jgi:DNA-binding MarR family transcriptional regulator
LGAVVNPSRIKRQTRGSPVVDYEALALFRYELRKFNAFSKAAAKTVGLTPQQHQALLTIRGFSKKEPISVGDLANRLLVQHHTAVGLLDRIEKLGLVSRSVDKSDGRRSFPKLTKKGERRLQALSKIHLEELQAVGSALGRLLETFLRSRVR